MAKWNITYAEYKKVLESDLHSLNDMLMEAKNFDELVNEFLDPANVPDDQVLPSISEAAHVALSNGDVVGYIELNAFLGALKKINTAKKKKRRK